MTTESFDYYGKLHKLLPCPFCGGPANFIEDRPFFFFGRVHSVGCIRGCTAPFRWQDDAASAALLWNTRAKPEEV